MDIPLDVSEQKKPESATELTAESILLEEFRHNNVLMYQHRETINSLFNLYLVLVSIVTSGIGAAAYVYIQNQTNPNYFNLLLVVSVLLALLTLLSFAFYAVFRNLRQAYVDSIAAMKRIEDFYITSLEKRMPYIADAFYWRHNRRHALGGDSRVMNWTSRLVGSISFGQALWVLLIYLIDHSRQHIPFPLFFAGNEEWVKIVCWLTGSLITFWLYAILYRSFARPPEVQETIL